LSPGSESPKAEDPRRTDKNTAFNRNGRTGVYVRGRFLGDRRQETVRLEEWNYTLLHSIEIEISELVCMILYETKLLNILACSHQNIQGICCDIYSMYHRIQILNKSLNTATRCEASTELIWR
jgi:hypothetical protein